MRKVLENRAGRTLLVFVIAMVVRSVYLMEVSNERFFALRIGDAQAYDEWARRIADGQWLGTSAFYQSPLYPYLLGAAYRISQRRLFIAVCQAVTGASACALLCAAGMNWSGRTTGLVAGLLLAFCGPVLFFDALLQKSSLDIVLVALLLWLISRAEHRPTRVSWLFVGVVLGLLSLNRENSLVLVPLLLAWCCWKSGATRWGRAGHCATLACAVGLTLAPAVIHNLVVAGEFHITTSQFGPNFFIGNNPHADGMYVPLIQNHASAEFERDDAIRIAERAAGRTLSAGEVSRYWTERALQFIRTRPREWLRLQARKLLIMVNRVEAADTEDVYAYADYSRALKWTSNLVNFGVLAPLAMLGVFVAGRTRSGVTVVYAMIVVYVGSVAIFFVLARYRLPLYPLLILPAAAGITGFRAYWNSAERGRRLLTGAVVLSAAVICNRPVLDAQQMKSITYFNFGSEFDQAGEHESALEAYQRAIACNPDHADAHYNLGISYFRLGRMDLASHEYSAALRLKPDFAAAAFNFGNLLLQQQHLDLAERMFLRALSIDPKLAPAENGLGMLRAMQGRLDEAIGHFENAARLDPTLSTAATNLARAREYQQQQLDKLDQRE